MMTAPAIPAAAPDPLTRRQLDVLRVITEWHDLYGVVPSYTELRAELDLVGRGSVHRLVDHLVAKGWLRRLPHRARGLQILHRPKMPDFDAVELVPSAQVLPEHLVQELTAAAVRYGEAAPCG